MKKMNYKHVKHFETSLYDVSKKITNLIFEKYNNHFDQIIKNFKDIKKHDKELFKLEIKNEILPDDLNHYVYLILAKSNCRCLHPNTKYCYSIYCESNNLTPIIQENNYKGSGLNHKKRGDKSNRKENFNLEDIKIFKEDNQIFYKKGKEDSKWVNLENIIETKFKNKIKGEKVIKKIKNQNYLNIEVFKNEILLFDQNIIENVYNIILNDSFDNDKNKELEKLINESLFDKILLEGKMLALHTLFQIGVNVLQPDKDKFEDLERKTNDYIDTVYGAGLYYLANDKPSGYISILAIKEAFKSLMNKELKVPKSKIKFTNDHIYRRKLAANYLRIRVKLDFKDFKKLYKERFSYISFITSGENGTIKKWDENSRNMEIPWEEFKEKYVEKLKPLGVDLIGTKIYSDIQMKSFIRFLYSIEVKKIENINYEKIQNIEICIIKDWFKKYERLINLFPSN